MPDPFEAPMSDPRPTEGAAPTLPASAFEDLETALRKKEAHDIPPPPCQWALVVYAGTQLGRVFPLNPGETTLGRNPQAGITLLDEEVSRLHAALKLAGDAADSPVQIQDLGSTNGTLVNGKPVEGIHRLEVGDRIALGAHVLKLVAMDPLERSFHETLLDQSTKDTLTGLANRAASLAELQSRFDLSQRHNRPLSVVMCDLDYFKRINDSHGHGAGDLVLKSFGEVVRQKLRGSDLAGRIGGEEFIVVLPETEMEGALFLAERLRSGLEERTMPFSAGAVRVTCSLGVAERGREDRDAGVLLARADAALYRAKTEGRNRVVAAESR